MLKPDYRWRTKRHTAFLEPSGGDSQKGREELFELRFESGEIGHLVCGLEEQRVDEVGAKDPDLGHAVRCWLIARGIRKIRLKDSRDNILAEGDISPLQLGPLDGVGRSERPQSPSSGNCKLISLCPSNLEILHALGVIDRVLACEDSSDWPEEVEKLPRLGPDLAPDLERVAELEPDLVLASLTVPGMERVVVGLHARGLPYLVLAPRNIADVLFEVEYVGRCLGLADQARAVCDKMRNEMHVLRQRAEARRLQRPSELSDPGVYLEWWPRPMFSPAKNCYSNELIELAGGRNVFRHREGSSVEVTVDEVLEVEPDLVFVSWCGVKENKLDIDRVLRRQGLESLAAIRHRRVYPLDEQFSGRPGPRMLEAARRIEQAIVALDAQRLSRSSSE